MVPFSWGCGNVRVWARRMKIAIAVHGRFHGFELAAELYRRGMLARLVTTYPAFAARRFVPDDLPLTTLPWLEVLRRLHPRLRLPGNPDLFIANQFARALASSLPEADILVGWSGATLEAIAPAQAAGIKVVLERGSTHISHQSEVLAEAHGLWGMPWDSTDPRLEQRELAEYEAADLICTGSSHARDTFVARGIAAEKLAINPYGVDLSHFSPPERPAGNRRVLFVGSVGVRKGVPWLIQAFRSLPRDWELHLIGPMERGFGAVLARLNLERVVLRGPLPGPCLPAEYCAADIFCLPSVEEGFGMVILQAMASGLPVIASTATGGPDAGVEILVPPGDGAALGEMLARLAADADLRAHLGAAGRASVSAGFGWSDYGDRAERIYRRLIPAGAP